MKIPAKKTTWKVTWIYILTIILLTIVLLVLINFVPMTAPLKNLIVKLIKPFVCFNIIISIILMVLRIKG